MHRSEVKARLHLVAQLIAQRPLCLVLGAVGGIGTCQLTLGTRRTTLRLRDEEQGLRLRLPEAAQRHEVLPRGALQQFVYLAGTKPRSPHPIDTK